MEERWSQIPLDEALGYEVSDLGRVRSWWGPRALSIRSDPLTLKLAKSGSYLQVRCGRRSLRVHTLVLLSFVGPRLPGMECRHLDGDPTHNRLENLTWGTPKENAADRRIHGSASVMCGEANVRAILKNSDVICIRGRLAEGVRGRLLALEFGVSTYTISTIKNGKAWKHLL